MANYQSTSLVHRRSFLGNVLKLAAMGSLLQLIEACNNEKKQDPENKDKEGNKPARTKKTRKKWNHEELVINTKTNVIHFPTSKVYKYYDPIASSHLQKINGADLVSTLKNAARLHNIQSGNILEILALAGLAKNMEERSLAAATDTLAIAFSKTCENKKGVNPNMFNFRLHELMLQLIAINPGIAAGDRWSTFNNKVLKPPQLRKRQKWMETETNFNQRVQYILDHQPDYKDRLSKRAARYSFT